jgi:hypothetical protein
VVDTRTGGRAEEDDAGVFVGMLDDDVQDFGEAREGPSGIELGTRSALYVLRGSVRSSARHTTI